MAGVSFVAVTGEVALTGGAAKTVLQVVAAANQRVRIREWSVSFDGTSNTAEPVKVDVLRQSTAGTMTGPTDVVKLNDSDDETVQTDYLHTATAEPTAGDVLFSEDVHPQTGYTWQAPFGGEIPIKGGGRLGIRCTAAANVNVIARVIGEE